MPVAKSSSSIDIFDLNLAGNCCSAVYCAVSGIIAAMHADSRAFGEVVFSFMSWLLMRRCGFRSDSMWVWLCLEE